MDQERAPALRGFDSYELRLGDELRGHRATLGKSLLDVQRELRIKASYIDAIENCDASVVPNRGFVPGYVRAYARYLGLDAEEVYARFCAESGFVGQTSRASQPGAAPRGGFRLGGGVGGGGSGRDPALSRSHFAAPIGRARPVGLGVSLSDLASVAVLATLLGGLGWGGWLVIEEVQRVEFAPGNDAPESVAGGPGALPGLALQAAPAPWLSSGPEREAALAELYAPREAAEPPVVELRDGPIAAIDPARSGFYAERATPATATAAAPGGPATPLADPDGLAAAPILPAAAAAAAPPEAGPALRGVWLEATAPCWVQVKDASGAVLFERIMDRGDRWPAPERGAGLVLRAGNAGGLVVEIDGVDHGPLGRSGEVVKNVPLEAERVAADWPEAPKPESGPAPARAEAKLELE